MPKQSTGQTARSSIELAEIQTGPVTTATDSSADAPRKAAWLVVPDWWAALIPGGFDYCNARNAPRFALFVCLLTLIIIAYQHLVCFSSLCRKYEEMCLLY